MADFCKQCSIEIFGEDFKELDGLVPTGHTIRTICEGCGVVLVNHLGECIDPGCPKHGKEVDDQKAST